MSFTTLRPLALVKTTPTKTSLASCASPSPSRRVSTDSSRRTPNPRIRLRLVAAPNSSRRRTPPTDSAAATPSPAARTTLTQKAAAAACVRRQASKRTSTRRVPTPRHAVPCLRSPPLAERVAAFVLGRAASRAAARRLRTRPAGTRTPRRARTRSSGAPPSARRAGKWPRRRPRPPATSRTTPGGGRPTCFSSRGETARRDGAWIVPRAAQAGADGVDGFARL